MVTEAACVPADLSLWGSAGWTRENRVFVQRTTVISKTLAASASSLISLVNRLSSAIGTRKDVRGTPADAGSCSLRPGPGCYDVLLPCPYRLAPSCFMISAGAPGQPTLAALGAELAESAYRQASKSATSGGQVHIHTLQVSRCQTGIS